MNIEELQKRLYEEGCNPASYKIISLRGADDCYCLTREADYWQVFYTERGSNRPPVFKSSDENEVCQFFYNKIMEQRQDHCVGRFNTKAEADALQTELSSNGIESYQDIIPYTATTKLYRIFVTRKAIFPTRELLKTIPRLSPE